MPQMRFWKDFYQLKVDIVFIQGLIPELERNERWLKMFSAVTSSVSIGAWVIWKEWAIIWGGVIAISQVVAAIHPHLPYKERLKAYSSVLREFEAIFIDAEHKWPSIADGSISSKEINKERSQLQKKMFLALEKHMPNSIFPPNKKVADWARSEAEKYFACYYPVEEYDMTDELEEGIVENFVKDGKYDE